MAWLYNTQAKPDTEFSELVLYEVQVMMEGDMYEAALKHMNSFESNICDTGCVFENKGTIHNIVHECTIW